MTSVIPDLQWCVCVEVAHKLRVPGDSSSTGHICEVQEKMMRKGRKRKKRKREEVREELENTTTTTTPGGGGGAAITYRPKRS